MRSTDSEGSRGWWSREWLPDPKAPPGHNWRRLRGLYSIALVGLVIVAALVRIVNGPPVLLAVLAFGFVGGIVGLLSLKLSWMPEIGEFPTPSGTTKSLRKSEPQGAIWSRPLLIGGLALAVGAIAGSALASALICLLGLAGLLLIAASVSALRSALPPGERLNRLSLGLRTRLLFVALLGCLWCVVAVNETARAIGS